MTPLLHLGLSSSAKGSKTAGLTPQVVERCKGVDLIKNSEQGLTLRKLLRSEL
jgi:hypothetical protein